MAAVLNGKNAKNSAPKNTKKATPMKMWLEG
jgi:hypothetical protein